MCDQVRKLLPQLLFWKPLVVVVGTCGPPRGPGVLSSACDSPCGGRRGRKGGWEEQTQRRLRFLLAGVFKAGVGCNKNLGFTFQFLTSIDCNSPGNSLHLTVFQAVSNISVFLLVPAESEGQILISSNICNAELVCFSWESCKTSLLTQLLHVLWDAAHGPLGSLLNAF